MCVATHHLFYFRCSHVLMELAITRECQKVTVQGLPHCIGTPIVKRSNVRHMQCIYCAVAHLPDVPSQEELEEVEASIAAHNQEAIDHMLHWGMDPNDPVAPFPAV